MSMADTVMSTICCRTTCPSFLHFALPFLLPLLLDHELLIPLRSADVKSCGNALQTLAQDQGLQRTTGL